MAIMQECSERAERLIVAVETSHGSGEFRPDPRLRVEEVWQRSDDAIGRAIISVNLDDNVDGEEIRRIYHPDRRLVVTTEHADVGAREILFEGYPPVQICKWDGRVGREGEQYVFEAEHVWGRYNRVREAWVCGRQMRTGAIVDGLTANPGGFLSRSSWISALPCIFNPDGLGNRALDPLLVAGPDGESRRVHIFASDDKDGARWTFAKALRYLAWFHLNRQGPVFEGNLFDVTDALAAGEPGDADPLREALAREPVSLTCEATTLVESLALLAAAAGVHITPETVNINGLPRTQLRVWSPRAGTCRKLYLARGGRYDDGVPRYNASGRSVRQILQDNNTYRGQVTWDHRPIVNHTLVLGDIKRYELTLPLCPGWKPVTHLDNVAPENRAAAKGLALTPDVVKSLGANAIYYDWYRRYHRDGSFYHEYSDVSRLWVLNEDGHFDGNTYNRNSPFNNYHPFDFATVLTSDSAAAGEWTRRVRPLKPALTRDADGRSVGVYVEVSFDAGATWVRPKGPIGVLKDRAGIHFDVANPTEIAPPGVHPASRNMWYAIIDQAFRVRVTAVLEGDDRLLAEFGPDGLNAPTIQVNSRVVRRPQSFKFASRSVGVNIFKGSATLAADERDDSDSVAELARWLARTRQDRRVQVAPAIPWIETTYGPGDRITEIAGRCIRFPTTQGGEVDYPAVVERRFLLQDGRFETVLTLQSANLPETVS